MNKNIKYIVLLLLLFLPFAYGSGIHNLKNSNTSKRGESLEKFKIIEINLDLLRVDCDTLSTIGIAIANSIAKLAISENREIFSEWKMRNNRCNLETAKQIHNIFFNVDSSLIKRSNIQLIIATIKKNM